ncbi:hypothetical protein [Corynebacterium massiliense]|nr:hypothetical protein [Corynebacterium massiliense]
MRMSWDRGASFIACGVSMPASNNPFAARAATLALIGLACMFASTKTW